MDKLLWAKWASIPPWSLLLWPFGTVMQAIGLIVQLIGLVIIVREAFLK